MHLNSCPMFFKGEYKVGKNKTKDKLIQQEQYFQALFEKAPLPYQSLDAEGHILDVNQAWLEKMGYERQEIIGRWFGDFLSKECHGIFMERFPCFKSLGMVSGVEFSMRRKDGTFFLGCFEGKIDKDEQGHFKRTHCIFTDITQQKAVENNLIKAKEKAERKTLELNKVQQITHIGTWYLDLGTNEVSWTEELYKMYGFDSALPPPPYTEHMKLFTPESWEILSTSLARTAETGIPYELELKTIRKDKSNGWLWCRGEAVFDQNKKIIGLWGAAQDITERKQLEFELKETAERFKALHNASFGGIAIHDKGKILECNLGLSEMTGYSVDELTGGMDGLLLIAPEHREMVMNKIVTGYEKPYEAYGLRKNGQEYPIRLEARNIPYKGKRVRTVEFRDITASKKAEDDLLSSNKLFQELFDNMSSGVAVYEAVDNGSDFVFKNFNKSGEKIENISRNQIIGKRVTEVFPKVRNFGLLAVFQRVFQTGNPEHLSAKIYQDSRIYGWRQNYVFKIPTGEIISVYDDITEQKKIEQQEKEIFAAQAAAEIEKQKATELFKAYEKLKITQNQLLQSEKMASIGQLGAGIAHELNSPLAGILSLLQSYKKEKDLYSEEYEDLDEMEKAAEHMVRIIKGLNIFSRQSTGEIEEVDCNEAINSVLGFTEYQFKQKQIKIEIKLNPDLWKIRANKNQIQQIIINMISNASDALAFGGAFKIVTNNFKMNDKDYVEMLFEDNGCGIKAEDLKKIFDPFFTTKRPGGGVGLGLSIVYKIVESHKGLITFDSSEGKGTIFTVRFPVN